MDKRTLLLAIGRRAERVERNIEEVMKPLRDEKNELHVQCQALGIDYHSLVKAARFRMGLVQPKNLTPAAELYLEVLGDPRKELPTD